jgi:hypothetical protein
MPSFSVSDAKPAFSQTLKINSKISDVKPTEQIPIFWMVSNFFIFCFQNATTGESDRCWKIDEETNEDAEDEIIEQAEAITKIYNTMSFSDDLKLELLKYIIDWVNLFNKKFEATHGKIYFDEYLDFLTAEHFDL